MSGDYDSILKQMTAIRDLDVLRRLNRELVAHIKLLQTAASAMATFDLRSLVNKPVTVTNPRDGVGRAAILVDVRRTRCVIRYTVGSGIMSDNRPWSVPATWVSKGGESCSEVQTL